MTILYPERFQQARPAGFDGVFDWDFLKGAFGPVIMPMDLDGVVERKGRFLVFETKEPGRPIPRGQEISLNALRATGIFTIFVVYGKTADTLTSMEEWHAKTKLIHESITPEKVWERSNEWYRHVSALPSLTENELRDAAKNSAAVSESLAQSDDLVRRLKIATERISWLERKLADMRNKFDLKPKSLKTKTAAKQYDLFGAA